MATFEERIYSLAVNALAEQERQVVELRSRASVLLAAAAVVPSLLARSVFHGDHPRGIEAVAAYLGLGGAAGVLTFGVLLLRPCELGFSMKAGETHRELWREDITEQPMIDIALADALDERRRENAETVRRLVLWLAPALASLVLETAGLALAAALTSSASWRRTPRASRLLRRRRCPNRARCRSCRRPSSTWRSAPAPTASDASVRHRLVAWRCATSCPAGSFPRC